MCGGGGRIGCVDTYNMVIVFLEYTCHKPHHASKFDFSDCSSILCVIHCSFYFPTTTNIGSSLQPLHFNRTTNEAPANTAPHPRQSTSSQYSLPSVSRTRVATARCGSWLGARMEWVGVLRARVTTKVQPPPPQYNRGRVFGP